MTDRARLNEFVACERPIIFPRGSASGILAWKARLEPGDQVGNVARGCAPDFLNVHDIVLVDERVAHAGHGGPGNFGVAFA